MKFNLELAKNLTKIFSLVFLFFVFFVFLFYFLILPRFFESSLVLKIANKIVKEQLNFNISLEKQKLKTSLKPEIEIKFDKLLIVSEKNKLVELDDFNLKIDFKKIFQKELELKELSAEKIFLNIEKIISNLPKCQNDKKTKTSNIKIKIDESDIKIASLFALYSQNDTSLDILIKDISANKGAISLESNVDIKKAKANLLNIKFSSINQIKFKEEELTIDNFVLSLNKSKLNINSKITSDNIVANITSDKFYLVDIFKFINSDLIIPNGAIMLSPLVDPKGSVSFDLSLINQDLSGYININNTEVKIKDVSNIPIKVSTGKINLLKDKIQFINLLGYYGKNKKNKIKITGDIKDYYKTFDSNIVIESVITNEFFKDYLSKLINNTVFYVSKPSQTKVIYKSKNNIMDIIWFAQINKGVDFGVTTEKSALSEYDRAVLGEFRINENKIDIKNINYYIASNIVRGVKLQPILQVNALLDFTGKIDKAGFAFGREMPCEFLNIFVGQKLFKKGTIKGNVDVVFENNIPYLNADMEIKKTLIPSQRIAVKEANLKTDKNYISINAEGRFKKAKYKVNGIIKNELKAPYVIRNLDLNLDNLDIERILNSFNNANSNKEQIESNLESSEEDLVDDDFMFDTNLIRIDDCNFTLTKGNYKELTFGNIKAKLILNEKGVLNINSNKFDIAQGISTLKVICDLKKLKYYIRLGVKDIDSNLMAKTLFNLDKEITGKATGLIELNGDESLKMNGDIKFVVKDGTIGKVGLVEYLLKIATVFRNPIVMVSPATIMDIISIPEGKFDKIVGTMKIKDNVVAPIDIKSYSNTLSALIKGKFDLERHDASLRIYTRFSTDRKSLFGLLRNLSLNSLANKVKFNSKNDANYYESELVQLPPIDVDESKTQVFLTQVEGDIEHFNFLSSLKRVK